MGYRMARNLLAEIKAVMERKEERRQVRPNATSREGGVTGGMVHSQCLDQSLLFI